MFFVFPVLSPASQTKFQRILDEKISKMSLEEKVGQLFIVGFPQKTITTDLESFIQRYKPGAFLLFKRNIQSAEQIRDLNTSLYRISYKHTKLPPLIAIDQEGGTVSRLPIIPAPPNALAIGQTQSPLLAEEMGYHTGLFLREVGFNMNLAPVLDLADPAELSFIGVRSFGADPQRVAELGTAYSKGLLRAHVVPTAKHFPGTGSLKSDPHHAIVENKSSLESLSQNDIKPYEKYVELGSMTSLMLSHLIYPALDPQREPASFSRPIVTDLLREKLKYSGLVVTDDLQMQGSKKVLRPEAAALRALQAGADVVMLTWSFADQGRAFSYVKTAVQKGELTQDEIDQKLRRILTVKGFANIYRRDQSQPSLLHGSSLTSQKYSELESNILSQNIKANITSVREPSSFTASQVRSICVLSPTVSFLDSFTESTTHTVKPYHLKGSFQIKAVMNWMKQQDCSIQMITITGPKTAALVANFPAELKKKSLVINLGAPRLFKQSEEYLKVVQLYFSHQDSGKKIAQYFDEILGSSQQNYVLR
ncbi:MAG: glycoside hydrolase family 3 protein [Bdellovibrio sp.]